jgi:hypothetical protein
VPEGLHRCDASAFRRFAADARRSIKSKPTLVVDHEITYAEAEPWLATRDRAVFEKRFAGRLRDPAFRSAAQPNLARYPMWDRMLNPEKYAPKPQPVK